MPNKKTRRNWPEEEKAKVLAELSSKSITEVAEAYAVSRDLIYRWAAAAGLSVRELGAARGIEAKTRTVLPLATKRAYLAEAAQSTAKGVEEKYGLSSGSIGRWKGAGVKPAKAASAAKTLHSNGAVPLAIDETPPSQPPPSVAGAFATIESQLQSALAQLKAVRQAFQSFVGG